ncbi:helix-turn-helix transcriptional regulator [Bacillus pumilus]|uniref:helix-turn-helix domain-containing protein n=1 Tax=Bacillus TaxID=1386 RepID=UPI0005557D87|nr:helix-turn-helix transcriptional regulator [Bacillus pumilus]MCR4352135.1 helix-turn-helix transcriptional regulator [Bacillus pumilus]MCY7503946.1 helix-turn-helix transcriptional regulator [Bacillus pumilus]MDR4269061.1 helix-turn-helix transcriptional regulator [Bacillus pumilus]MDR4269148.1 helix-turn-helix transcriptional regulator [Bacillus pumilus]MED4724231.1 helix-turn-helix transcriptional regulator [Bacillus pumilus]
MELYVKLDDLLAEIGMTKKELAEKAGLRPNVISELSQQQRTTVNRSHIGKICEVLEIRDMNKLFEVR